MNTVSRRAGKLWVWIRRRRTYLLLAYAVIEAVAYRRYLLLCRHLAAFRTPLSINFPRCQWRRFFASRLRIEARRRPADTRVFLERVFYNRRADELTREDVECWLRMYLSTFEDAERPPNWSASQPLCRARDLAAEAPELPREEGPPCETEARGVEREAARLRRDVEEGLGVTFLEGPREHDFIRINSPATNHTPMTPIFSILPHRLLKMALSCAASCLFRGLGFKWLRDAESGMGYWHRGTGGAGLLFVHGFGLGQLPYAFLVCRLASMYPGPLVLAECPGIGQSGVRGGARTPWPRSDEIAESLARLKHTLRIETLHAVGHSFGGMILSAAQKYQPNLIDRVAYIESPVFLFRTTEGWPDIFKQTTCSDLLGSLLRGRLRRLLVDYVLADPWHQHVIHQAIWLWEYVHWETNLDERTLVALASGDDLCHPAVARWLREEYPAVQVEAYEGAHGSLCYPRQSRRLALRLMAFFRPGPDREHAPTPQ